MASSVVGQKPGEWRPVMLSFPCWITELNTHVCEPASFFSFTASVEVLEKFDYVWEQPLICAHCEFPLTCFINLNIHLYVQ